jgi:hypothetical protein
LPSHTNAHYDATAPTTNQDGRQLEELAGGSGADDQGLKALLTLAQQRAQQINSALGPGSINDGADLIDQPG